MPYEVTKLYDFGSDETFRKMQAAAAGDRDQLAEILLGSIMKTMFTTIGTRTFWGDTDRDDLIDIAVIKVYKVIDDFLADSRNQPAEGEEALLRQKRRRAWLKRILMNEYLTERRRHVTHGETADDDPASEGPRARDRIISYESGAEGEKDVTRIAVAEEGIENTVAQRALIAECMKVMAQLPNNLNTIVCVVYTILYDTLAGECSMEKFADMLEGAMPSELVSEMRIILRENGMPEAMLDPLEKRVGKERDPKPVTGLTSSKLSNRKNAVLTAFKDAYKARETDLLDD